MSVTSVKDLQFSRYHVKILFRFISIPKNAKFFKPMLLSVSERNATSCHHFYNLSSCVIAGVNFINVMHTNFSYEHCFGSIFYVHVTREKLPRRLSYKKFLRITLMKLTAVLRSYLFAQT